MTGAYIVFEYPKGVPHPNDIAFQLQVSATEAVPEEQANLKSEVERTLDVLRTIFHSEDSKFRGYYDELLGLSRYGLVGPTAQPDQATDTLHNLQRRILDAEKGKAINRHMRHVIYTHGAIYFSLWAASLVAAAIVAHIGFNAISGLLLTPAFALLGLFFGCVFSAFLRCRAVTFYELHAIEADRFSPFMKCMFALVTLVIGGGLLKAGVIEFSLGQVPLDQFDKSALSAFTLGTVVGVAQEAVIARIEAIKSSSS